jgi:hypothetical protein
MTGKRCLPPSCLALFLHRQRVAQLLADPFRLQGVGADQHGVGRRAVDRLFYFRPQRVAAAQLARIDPSWLAQRLFGTAASSRESVLVSNHSCHNRLAVRNDCSYRKDL